MDELAKVNVNGKEYHLKDETARQGSGGNADLSITGAKVGQTVKIAAVDENGVPTAWLPTDFPSGGSGGGESSLELIIDTTVPENCERAIFREDVNGNEFELSEILVSYSGARNTGNLSSLTIFLRTHSGYLDDTSAQYNYNGPLANLNVRTDYKFAIRIKMLTDVFYERYHTPGGGLGESGAANMEVVETAYGGKSIKQIAFIVSNANSGEDYRITAGTRIMIWGRRV